MGVELKFERGGIRGEVLDDFCPKAAEILKFAGFNWTDNPITPDSVRECIEELIQQAEAQGVSKDTPVVEISTGGLSVCLSQEDDETIIYIGIQIETWFYK